MLNVSWIFCFNKFNKTALDVSEESIYGLTRVRLWQHGRWHKMMDNYFIFEDCAMQTNQLEVDLMMNRWFLLVDSAMYWWHIIWDIWLFGVKSWFFTRNTPKHFAPPSAIGKNTIFFGVKSWIFTRNSPTIFVIIKFAIKKYQDVWRTLSTL
jgi:hypothetical protein